MTDDEEAVWNDQRKARARRRFWWTVYGFVTGLVLVLWDNWEVRFHGAPLPVIGWFVMGLFVFGMLGFNIWEGTPEDTRLDRRSHDDAGE